MGVMSVQDKSKLAQEIGEQYGVENQFGRTAFFGRVVKGKVIFTEVPRSKPNGPITVPPPEDIPVLERKAAQQHTRHLPWPVRLALWVLGKVRRLL